MTTDAQIVDAKPVEALAKQEQQPHAIVAMTPAQMLSEAVHNNSPLAVVEKLMDLQDRDRARQAREAYVAAMATFQAVCPVVIRTGYNTHLKVWYPQWDTTHEQIRPALNQAQLSVWHQITRDEKDWIEVEFVCEHIMGHRETVRKGGPIDTGPGRNLLQARMSTTSYLKRETAFLGLGLRSRPPDKDEKIPDKVAAVADTNDNDGQDGPAVPPAPKPQSAAMLDPAETKARKDFWNVCQRKANVKFSREQVVALFAKVQAASGKQSTADCLAWVSKEDVLIGKDGGLAILTDQSVLAGDPFAEPESTAAADDGPPPPAASPAPQPPATEYECDECGTTYPAKTLRNKCLMEGCMGHVVQHK